MGLTLSLGIPVFRTTQALKIFALVGFTNKRFIKFKEVELPVLESTVTLAFHFDSDINQMSGEPQNESHLYEPKIEFEN